MPQLQVRTPRLVCNNRFPLRIASSPLGLRLQLNHANSAFFHTFEWALPKPCGQPCAHPLALGSSWMTRIVRSLRVGGAMAVEVKAREAAPVHQGKGIVQFRGKSRV